MANPLAVNIPATEEIAMKLATEASEAAFDPSNRFLFTHGASVTNKTQQNQESSGAGACITYKQANHDSWHTKHFSLGYCATGDDEAGLVAISRCLSLVSSDLLRAPNQQRAPKITVFTHYQDALRTIDGARNIGSITRHQGTLRSISSTHYIDSTTEQVQATPALLEVVKKSRFLCRKLGAKLELQWMPHHATAERYRLAEAAALSQTLPVSKTLPCLQRLRQDQNIKSSHHAYHRRELVHKRRSYRGRPSPLARQATLASSTTQQPQPESRHLIVENLRNLRISDDSSTI